MSYLLDLLFPSPVLPPDLLISRGVRPHPPFDSVLSLYRYHPPLSNFIHNIKYKFLYSQAHQLSSLACHEIKLNYKNILSYWQKYNFTIIPVPLHPIRQSWRGFNQSELLASTLAKDLGLNIDSSLLKRIAFTRPQVKLDDFSRQLHFANKTIFALKSKAKFGNYILFDDVATTGSTLFSCLNPLLPYCDKKPWGLTIAG